MVDSAPFYIFLVLQMAGIAKLFFCLGLSAALGLDASDQIPIDHYQSALPKPAAITQLKKRQPHWRSEVIERYHDGNPKVVHFIEPLLGNPEGVAVQRREYDQRGELRWQVDLLDTPGIRPKETVLFHGPAVSFDSAGTIESVIFYYEGELHGDCLYYDNCGNVTAEITYQNGLLNGSFVTYHPNGKLSFRGNYSAGRREGLFESFHHNGVKASEMFYRAGLLDGSALSWESSGALSSKSHFFRGLLHGGNSAPAVTRYFHDQKIYQVRDFCCNQPHGNHIENYPDGTRKHLVRYEEGKKHGVEEWFTSSGQRCGLGEYLYGMPIGEQIRCNDEGVITFCARYDHEGKLLAPIREWSGDGQLCREWGESGGRLEGDYFEWSPISETPGKDQSGDNRFLSKHYHFHRGKLEGMQREYYPNDQIKKEGCYSDDQRDGAQREWNQSGVLLSEGNYWKGLCDGDFYRYDHKGSCLLAGSYRLGKRDGIYQQWHSNGGLAVAIPYEGGMKEGCARRWGSDGTLLCQLHYRENRRHGLLQEWHASGVLKRRCNYYEGKLEGFELTWHQNGALKGKFHYCNGEAQGAQCEYYPTTGRDGDPLLALRCFYDDGLLTGEQSSFYPSGAKKWVAHYYRGKLHGVKTTWSDEGTLLTEENYQHGNLHGKLMRHSTDGSEHIYHYREGVLHGEHQIYFPDHPFFGKKLKFSARYVDGALDGEAIEYNQGGSKIASSPYKKGVKEGVAKIYHPEGWLKIAAQFQRDNQNGYACEYFPNGAVAKKAIFTEDKKDGEEVCYFSDGRLAAQRHFKAGALHGPVREWDLQGILRFQGNYRDGERHGSFVRYSKYGSPMLSMLFCSDCLLEKWKRG